jgi:hypothetical protein
MARRRQQSKPLKSTVAEAPDSLPADEQDATDFWAQVQHLSPADWQSGHKVYVYRCWPVIDRRDEQHYLAKLSEPFDEDVILRNWGSGKYNLRLNNGQGETICSRTVSLHNPAFPPKVAPDEVVATDPRNERYFKAWPVTPQPGAAPPADNAAVHELSKLATRVLAQRENGTSTDGTQDALTTTLVKWALDQTSKERDASDPTRIAALLKELKALIPQQQPGDGLAMVDRVLSIVEKVNPARTKAEPQDPLDYVQKVLTLAEKLRPQQTNPAAAAGDGGGLASVAAIIHEAGELFKNPLTILAQVWAASKVPAPQAAASIATAPQQPPPQSPMQAAQARLMAFLMGNIRPMQKHFEDFLTGATREDGSKVDGSDFAYWVWEYHGEEPLKDARMLGAGNILAGFKAFPFWSAIAQHEAKFTEFLDGVLKFEPPSEDEERAEDPEDAFTDLTRPEEA